MFSLIAPPAFSGTLLGLVPIIIMTLAVYVLLYGPYISTTDWVLDSYKLHYMDSAVDPDNFAKARSKQWRTYWSYLLKQTRVASTSALPSLFPRFTAWAYV